MNDLLIKKPVLLVGIGGAGSKVAAAASTSLGCKCLLISNDKRDFLVANKEKHGSKGSSTCFSVLVDSGEWVNPSRYKLRSFVRARSKEIISAMSCFSTIIVVSNLAGRAGTAMAPLICKMAQEHTRSSSGAVISVAIMPFKFEKDRIFPAGISLKRIREVSDSTIVIDNDAFLDNYPELSQEECYNITNGAIIEVITSIISSASGSIVRADDMNILCTSKPGSDSESLLRDSIAMLYNDVSDTSNIKRAILYVMGGDKVPIGTLNRLVGYAQGIFKEEGTTEVAMSSMATASGSVRIHLVASAPQKTRFDRYDPLGDIIPKENVLDWDEPDSAPDIQLTLPSIEQ